MSDVTLQLGDCLELLKGISDKSIDCVITDPPYGKQCDLKNYSGSRWNLKHGFSALWISNQQGGWNYKPTDETIQELFRVSRNQIIWGGNYFSFPPSSCWLIWNKCQRNFSFADAEMAWTSFNKATRIFDFSRAKMNGENKEHPTQKPLALIEWCVANYTQKGDTILDPFMGSGTTGVACVKLNRNFIGIEISPQYYEIAKQRIAIAQSQTRML